MKKELSEKYDIETRTISNFLNAQLQSYKLTGGNRNRPIVLKSQKQKPQPESVLRACEIWQQKRGFQHLAKNPLF